ncbi:MAG: type II secretion system minor pseudopilin GspJ [Porticoccaceae bacterium]|jgi:general secretion pathway protein J|nr:type II secretion system minor pseudopilin GspJ [Porticoccaceae bacterium]|tara:strand:+ start:7503 stop:8120 length:618 start_codon:yes stop_codon:yes gene_type:complete
MVKKIANRESGFTLIEAIVSLALLAVISVMSYQAVEVVTKVNERSRSGVASEAQLQRAWQIIGRDLMHIRPRRFHDGLGDIEGAYLTNPSDFGVRFSRGGGPMLRTNPSGMRRVNYTINEDDQLIRTSWAITESPRQSDGTTLILLDKVQDVEFNHLDGNGNYSVDWPPLNSRQTDKALPRMISVTIITENEVETSRLFPGVVSD